MRLRSLALIVSTAALVALGRRRTTTQLDTAPHRTPRNGSTAAAAPPPPPLQRPGILFYTFSVAGREYTQRHHTNYRKPLLNKVCYCEARRYRLRADTLARDSALRWSPGYKDGPPVDSREWVRDNLSGKGPGQPTYAKPHLIRDRLAEMAEDAHLVWVDMDVVFMDSAVDFSTSFVENQNGSDIILTDHNAALNNGVVVFRNSAFTRRFVDLWVALGHRQSWAYSDNGSFLETMLQMSGGAGAAAPYVPMSCGALADKGYMGGERIPLFFECVAGRVDALSGPFDGRAHRSLGGQNGTFRLLRPREGFNSHVMKSGPGVWHTAAAYDRNERPPMFGLHTKTYDRDVPSASIACGRDREVGEALSGVGEHFF